MGRRRRGRTRVAGRPFTSPVVDSAPATVVQGKRMPNVPGTWRQVQLFRKPTQSAGHLVNLIARNLAIYLHERPCRSDFPRDFSKSPPSFSVSPGPSRHAGGMTDCASSMSAMTARMNSSAASVMPPATPP